MWGYVRGKQDCQELSRTGPAIRLSELRGLPHKPGALGLITGIHIKVEEKIDPTESSSGVHMWVLAHATTTNKEM